ncbi:MAG: hypothetical protein HEP71_19245 [Roseivirga sp.]|nr:hypothetical protein [Roseivirga sp.]
MIKTFTQDDLVRYIYQETTPEESIEIETALIFDEQLSETYNKLSATVESLKAVNLRPSDTTVDKILSYSRSYDLHALR